MPSVYGEAFLDGAHDALITYLEALKTSMTAYSPTFSYVYPRHQVADLRLNAVTIELSSATAEPYATGNDRAIIWPMTFDVRVHTGYEGDPMDGQAVARLLNSIANKFKANITISAAYRIMEVTNIQVGQTFSESATVGGSLQVTVQTVVQHVQE